MRCFRRVRHSVVALATLCALAGAGVTRATTVTPPTFAALVTEAESIVRAKVVAVQPAWAASPQGRVIKTFVTLQVERWLKGNGAAQLTLQFLGGELDGEELRVAGMPRFHEGQTTILFVSGNGVRFCPLVGMMHGRYHVLPDPDGAREYVARDDGVPLVSEHDVQLRQSANAVEARFKPVSAALSPADFEQKIATEHARHVSNR